MTDGRMKIVIDHACKAGEIGSQGLSDSVHGIVLSRRDAIFLANLLDAPIVQNEALKRANQRYAQWITVAT